jgi:hypothetical protein
MKKYIRLFLVSFIIITSCQTLYAQDYAATSNKDFLADAPWRVKSLDAKIPLILTIKDADQNDCIVDTFQIWIYDKINNRDSLIHRIIYGGLTVNSKRWEEFWEVSVNDLRSSPYNLTISDNDTLKFNLRLSFRDNILSEYFTQYLRVVIGTSGFPAFANWYSGDSHFHSEFTDNAYEFGSSIKATSKAGSAMGLDWLTVTDHSCDFPAVGVGFPALLDSINKYNLSSSCMMVRGQEVTIDNNNTNNLVDDKIHLLVYNQNLFIRGPENYFTFTNDNSGNLTYLNSALTQNVNAISYAAHPLDEMLNVAGSLIGNLLAWSDNNYSDALTHRDNFKGLEFWNTKELFTKDITSTLINPFPFNQNSTNKTYTYKSHLTLAESKWIQLLMNDLPSFNSTKKLFALGGSDAHGDLNYQVYSSTNLVACDNAIAKVRTLAYLPNGKTLDNLLSALKNGNTVVSDGPVIVFDMDMNGDGIIDPAFGIDAHIGDDKVCNYTSIDSNNIKIFLKWNNTDEFGGNIKKFVLHIITNSTTQEYSLNGHFGINESKSGSAWISLKDLASEFNFNYTLDAYSLFKFVAYTQDSLYRCYTNPVWLKIESPTGINIHLTALIEGLYNASSNSMIIRDTLQVELRNINFPYGRVDSSKVIVDTFGKGTIKFASAPTGDYYIVIKHRNSIETWSKSGGQHLVNGTISDYDFTSAQTQAYGNNLIHKGTKWCIYSGDVTGTGGLQDGIVDLSDLIAIDNDNANYFTGLVKTDVNGDGLVDLSDLILADNNNSAYVAKVVPPGAP